MLLDAENPAGLQRLERRGQDGLRIAVVHPVVQIAERQDEIGGASRGDIVVNRAQPVLLRRHPVAPPLGAGVFFGIARRGQRNIVHAALLEIGAENFGPVAAAGPQLHHRHRGLDPENGQFLRGMTRLVARDEGGRAAGVRHRRGQRGVRHGGRRNRADAGRDQGGGGRQTRHACVHEMNFP